MKGLKIHIKSNSDRAYTDRKQYMYTGAYHELYKQKELIPDPGFKNDFCMGWEMEDLDWRSLVSDVKATVNSKMTNDAIKQERINDIFEALIKKQFDDIHTAFKKRRKAFELTKSIGKECCFGNINILRKISKECNKPENEQDSESLRKWREEWKDSRNRGFYVMGEANQKCNRFYDLTKITSGIIVYKPNRKTRIELTFNPDDYKSFANDLKFIEEQARLKQNHPDAVLPVSILLKGNDLILQYDEEIVNGFGFDSKSYNLEVKELKEKNLVKDVFKAEKKKIGSKYFEIQKEIKLKDKIQTRCIGIDMNPNYIGYAVIDLIYDEETGEYTYKVLRAGCFVTTSLNRKTGYRSSDSRQKYLTDKRHHELSIIAKKLIAIANHYQCCKFILEDLELDKKKKECKDVDEATREFHRQTKNIWCRRYLEQFITKRCNECGIILERILPMYTSFIGNIQHKFIDPVNAAVEIARRGFLKYRKNTFYPEITEKDLVTLGTMFGDGVDMTGCGWIEVYKSAKKTFTEMKDFSHRWRKRLDSVTRPYERCSMCSCKSMVRHIVFH